MSLFEHPDIDSVLLTYLSIDDLKELSQVNKYYYDLTKHKLQPFGEFFAIRNNLTIILRIYDGWTMTIDSRLGTDENGRLFVQSFINNNYNVATYIHEKYNPNMEFKPSYTLRIGLTSIYMRGGYRLYEILLMICIQKKTDHKLIEFIINICKKHCLELLDKTTITIDYLTSDYDDDYKVRSFILNSGIIAP